MDECLGRNTGADGAPVLPVAYLICNQTPPLDGTPSLMSFDEVETLFHEFGQISGLQMNVNKTVFILLWPLSSTRNLRNLIHEICPL